MFCPNCGTDCGRDSFCPVCGEKCITLPTGRIWGVDGYVDVGVYTLTFWKDSSAEAYTICVQNLSQVILSPATDGEYGFFAVGEGKVVHNLWEAMLSETAIVFEEWENIQFAQLYAGLEAVTKQNKPRKKIICPRCYRSDGVKRSLHKPIRIGLEHSFECWACGYWWYENNTK